MNGISNTNRQQASFGAIDLRVTPALLNRLNLKSARPDVQTLNAIIDKATTRLAQHAHTDTLVLSGMENQGVAFSHPNGYTKTDRKFDLTVARPGEKPTKVRVAFDNNPMDDAINANIARSGVELADKLTRLATGTLKLSENIVKLFNGAI